jgi:2'-5' RNA ligase
MPFAIELLFDPKTDKSVRRIGERLEKIRIPTILSGEGASPHVTLAVFDKYSRNRIPPLLNHLARRFSPIPFSFSSLGSFPGAERALFLSPVMTPELLKLHSQLHGSIKHLTKGALSYYKPGSWVPHCTLGLGLSKADLTKAFNFLQKTPYSLRGLYNRLALAEYHPVKEIYSVPLALPKG